MSRLLLILALLISVNTYAEIKLEKLAKSQWLELRTDNFIVVTDASEKTARAVVRDLENFRYFISFFLKHPMLEGGHPLRVLAINKKKNFKALDLPEQWAGVFFKRMSEDMAIANISDYKIGGGQAKWGNQILQHEYVHYAVKNMESTLYYPLWYSEGEAEYLATFQFIKNRSEVQIGSTSVAGNRVRALIRNAGGFRGVDTEDLFKTTNLNIGWRRDDKNSAEKRQDSRDTERFYARAMITYHYLQSTRNLKDQTATYLALINQGRKVDEAFSKAFGLTWDELDLEVKKYMEGRAIVWHLEVGEHLTFPEANPNIKQLESADALSHIITSVALIGSYKKEEVKEMLEFADKNATLTPELMLTKLFSHEKGGESLDALENEAKEKFGDNASILATIAQRKQPLVQFKLLVGHSDAKKEARSLRSEYRKILGQDPFNRLAYLGLGKLYAYTDNKNPKLLQEASVALESARLLVDVGTRKSILNQELNIHTRLNKPASLLDRKYQYASLSDGDWIQTGYGRFVFEMLELWKLGQSKGVASSEGLVYEEGGSWKGAVLNGLPAGQGTLTTYYGARLSGKFSSGLLVGEGHLKASNDFEYLGQFTDGVVTGKGKLTFKEGENVITEIGNFQLGQEHGQIKIIRPGYTAEGNYIAGVPHGTVKFTLPDGSKREQEYYQGWARFNITENLIFAGSIKEFKPNGTGACYMKNENQVFPCEFEDGEPKGEKLKNYLAKAG